MSPDETEKSLAGKVADVLDDLGFEVLTDDYREEHRAAEAGLADAFDPLPDALAEVPEVHEVNKVSYQPLKGWACRWTPVLPTQVCRTPHQ